MRFRSFKPDDLNVEDPIDVTMPDNLSHLNIVAVTAEDDDGVLGCGGLLFWKEGAEFWLKMAGRTRKNPRLALDCIMGGFEILMGTVECDVFCRCDVTNAKANRLVQWLGFRSTEEIEEYNGRKYLTYRL
jgi:hypothetical protein